MRDPSSARLSRAGAGEGEPSVQRHGRALGPVDDLAVRVLNRPPHAVDPLQAGHVGGYEEDVGASVTRAIGPELGGVGREVVGRVGAVAVLDEEA